MTAFLSSTRPESGFMVEIDRFQGPLDLLLHLIRQQDIDIFDIPIARITDQFLAAVKGIDAAELDSAGEFLEMAATLIRIKAQMLLPRPQDDEDEDPRAELVRRLLEYEQIREITQRLERAEAERARRRAKGYVEERTGPPPEDVPLETTWDEVFQAAVGVTLPELLDRDHRISPRTVSMEEKAVLILEAVRGRTGVEFSRLLDPFREKIHGVMTFLAGLELSRRRRIYLRQTHPFRELWLYGRDQDAGQENGADPGADPGEENGEENGADPGEETGADPGADPGEDPGAGPGAENGQENGEDPDQETDEAEGAAAAADVHATEREQ